MTFGEALKIELDKLWDGPIINPLKLNKSQANPRLQRRLNDIVLRAQETANKTRNKTRAEERKERKTKRKYQLST